VTSPLRHIAWRLAARCPRDANVRFAAEKGGIGKSTLVLNIAALLALRSRLRVLIVEAEPQGRLTTLLEVRPLRTLAEVLAREVTALDAIASTRIPRLDLLAGGAALGDVVGQLAGATGGEFRLLRTMEPALAGGRYDVMLVDTPGQASGEIAAMAMIFARRVIAPLDVEDDGSLAGVIKVMNIVADLNADGRYGIEVVAMLPNRDRRSRAAREIRAAIDQAPAPLPPLLCDPIPVSAEFRNLALAREVLSITDARLSPTGQRARDSLEAAGRALLALHTHGAEARVA
jgi:cellulose biosynthesis protein BcsQ